MPSLRRPSPHGRAVYILLFPGVVSYLRTVAKRFLKISCFNCKLCGMLRLVTDTLKTLRVDPCRSKVFSWIFWQESAEAVVDERGRTIQPAGPSLTVRYRTTGSEWIAWPVSEEEAVRVCRPGAEFDYSSGRAYSQLISPYKSKRMVKSGERQATKQQREEIEQRAGRRWLA
jgi:hypothetical protein